jgi:hypothetical protein
MEICLTVTRWASIYSFSVMATCQVLHYFCRGLLLDQADVHGMPNSVRL